MNATVLKVMDAVVGTSDNATGDYSNITEHLKMPSFYSMPYKTVSFLFVFLIFLLGFIGNVLVVIVVWRTRSLHTPTNCYLVSLALADILLLVSAPLPTMVELFLVTDYNGWLGLPGCVIMVFSQYLGVNVSSLSITLFTIERYIAICHPMRAQTMCTVRRAKRIIAALWIFGFCYCAPWLGLVTIVNTRYSDGSTVQSCKFKLQRSSYLTYYMADLVIFYVIPLFVTCILYSLIGRILYTSTLPSTHTACNGSSTHGSIKVNNSSARSSRVQVIKMLAIVVCLFAILWMPYRVYVVYNSFAKQPFEDLWFLLFCRIMIYMNSAINPILYNAMSVKFRRAFKRQLSCGTPHKTQTIGHPNYTQVTTQCVNQQEHIPMKVTL